MSGNVEGLAFLDGGVSRKDGGAQLVALATQAEEHFAGDPTVTLFFRARSR